MAFDPVSWCHLDLCLPDIQEYLNEKHIILIPSELETAQILARNSKLVRIDSAERELTHRTPPPKWLPKRGHMTAGCRRSRSRGMSASFTRWSS